jgi:lysophospholipid acyltransferase (LPLAT)-like uncharacterized protein
MAKPRNEIDLQNKAPGDRPGKESSLTRARPSRNRLSPADRFRAACFATAVGVVSFFLGASMRVRTVGEDRLAGFRALGPGPLLFAMWHGDFYPIFYYARHSGLCVVVSRSRDGEILHRVLKSHGYTTVRGSNTRGGTRAIIDLARTMQDGADAAIAVDGPRGPRHVVKAGIVLLAKVTGCPIVPLAVGISRYKQFNSWDRMRMPLPFSRTLLTAGDVVVVPPDADEECMESRRGELERALHDLSQKMQAAVSTSEFMKAERPRGFAVSRPR